MGVAPERMKVASRETRVVSMEVVASMQIEAVSVRMVVAPIWMG